MAGVVPLAPHHAAQAARVLGRAFQDDPMMVHLVPDAERRRQVLPSFLGGAQRYCLSFGVVHTTPEVAGVACWLPPGATTVTNLRMLRSGMLPALLRLGPGGLRRLGTLVRAMDDEHHGQVPGQHWYLWLLATEPSCARRGVAGRLLAPVLGEADAAGSPVYLDTHNQANLRFYAGHGFTPVVDRTVDGLRFWGLRREPRAAPRR